MDKAIEWCSGSPLIYPFYWIDPGAPDAVELVDMAVEKGFYGFKVIRGSGKPVDSRTLRCYRQMAKHGKPVTFHSGILWDGQDSSDNFRPANWEGLLEVPHLRFCLAHVSWPWYDECIAVYGKLLNATAHEGHASAPNSGQFIARYRLTSASSVSSSLKSLTDKELVYKSPAGYQVYDRFFGLWLSRR